MKSLQETLSNQQIQEGIFDTNTDSLTASIIQDWVETWICDDWVVLVKPGESAPEKKRAVEIRNDFDVYIAPRWSGDRLQFTTMYEKRPRVFDGFPAGIRFFNMKTGKPMEEIELNGNITSIKNIPITDSGNSSIEVHCGDSTMLEQSIIDELAKHKKYKRISIGTGRNARQSNVDFTKLNGYIKTLEIFSISQDLEFNESLKVDILGFGYGTEQSRLINLPEVKKVISFKVTAETVQNIVSDCTGNDAINWDRVEVKGQALSSIDKTLIKNVLSQNAENNASMIDPNKIYAELKKFMSKSPNKDTDVTKDAFGFDLHPGDIVVYSGAQGQAMLDVYVSSPGTRIKTVYMTAVKPHQIINLNNPALFDIIKKYSETVK